jgi:hypothetical protein
MKYKLVLNFYVPKKDDRVLKFLEKAMGAFRETFPDAKEVDEKFATVSWDEDSEDSPEPRIGKSNTPS